MRKTEVTFLKYFNRPPVIVTIEVDTIVAVFFIGLVLYVFFTIAGFSLANILTFSVFGGAVGGFYYAKMKDEYPKGYLKHLLYRYINYKNIKNSKFEREKEKMDISVDEYYPDSHIKMFTE